MLASCAFDRLPLLGLLCLVALVVTGAGCAPQQAVVPTPDALYLEAQKHMASGDNAKAMEAINASIAQESTPWARYLRAQLFLAAGDEASALKDCDEGLQADPGDPKLTWLKGELAKPPAARFQGQFKNPPSEGR